MITIDNVGFELQARTKKTSGRGLGTVFSAAAAKEANTAIVEGRINSQGNLICIAFSLVVWSFAKVNPVKRLLFQQLERKPLSYFT